MTFIDRCLNKPFAFADQIEKKGFRRHSYINQKVFPMVLLVILLISLFCSIDLSKSSIRSSHFLITNNQLYKPLSPFSSLSNQSANSIHQCLSFCLSSSPCQTAVFFRLTKICSLFNEPKYMGTPINYSQASLASVNPLLPCQNVSNNVTLLSLFNVSTINYTYYSYSYRSCSSTATLTFAFRHEVNTWFLDDVSVSNGTSNVLINGDFEIGNITGWKYHSSVNRSYGGQVTLGWGGNQPHSGSRCFQDGNNFMGYLSQTFLTIPNFSYRISFWLRSNAYTNSSGLVVSATVYVT